MLVPSASPPSMAVSSPVDWQHMRSPVSRILAHSSGVKAPSLSDNRRSSPLVKPTTCSDLALSACKALGSTIIWSDSGGIARTVAVAIVFSGIAAVRRPRMAVCRRAGMIVRFYQSSVRLLSLQIVHRKAHHLRFCDRGVLICILGCAHYLQRHLDHASWKIPDWYELS